MIKRLVIIAAFVATSAFAQQYTISRPDVFGETHIRGPHGFNGTVSRPDVFGESHFRYNNGVNGVITQPNVFGERTLRYHTMPRRWGW